MKKSFLSLFCARRKFPCYCRHTTQKESERNPKTLSPPIIEMQNHKKMYDSVRCCQSMCWLFSLVAVINRKQHILPLRKFHSEACEFPSKWKFPEHLIIIVSLDAPQTNKQTNEWTCENLNKKCLQLCCGSACGWEIWMSWLGLWEWRSWIMTAKMWRRSNGTIYGSADESQCHFTLCQKVLPSLNELERKTSCNGCGCWGIWRIESSWQLKLIYWPETQNSLRLDSDSNWLTY